MKRFKFSALVVALTAFFAFAFVSCGEKKAPPPATYTVTFNANGGDGAMETQTFTENVEQALTTSVFTMTGHDFTGWSLESGDKVAYTDGQTITIDADISLYAVWTAQTYEVTFNANGGEGSMTAQTFTYDEEQDLTQNAFTKEGHTFVGWATSETGNVAYGDEQPITVSEDTALYALWEANKYEMTFNANGGNGSMDNQSYTYGVAANLTSNAFTKTGYTFQGWATEAGGEVVYADGASVSLTENDTLYAVWKINSYQITFDANGGEGTMEKQSVEYLTPAALNENKFTKTGYTFQGWATEASGEAAYADKSTVSLSEDETLYAVWTINTYTVTFNANGGSNAGNGTSFTQSFTYGESQALTGNKFEKAHHTFAGWATSADGEAVYTNGQSIAITEDTNLYAVWTPNTYTVTFYKNDGSNETATQTFTYGVPQKLTENSFTRDIYNFLEWSSTIRGDGDVYSDGQEISLTGDINLYAQWIRKKRTLNYYVNGEIVHTQSVWTNYEYTLWDEAEASESSYVAGWAIEKDGEMKYDMDDSVMITKDTDFYAVWKLKTYTVTFYHYTYKWESTTRTFEHGVEQALPTDIFARTGHDLAGWALENEGEMVYTDGQTVSFTKEMDLYAVWKAATYTVTFLPNGGEGTMEPQIFTYGVPQALSACTFTPPVGKKFYAWSTGNINDSYWSAGEVVTVTRDMELPASWDDIYYTFSYYKNYGDDNTLYPEGNRSYKHGATATVPEPTYRRTGYEFAGWALEKDGEMVYPKGSTITYTANVIAYAVWEPKPITVSYYNMNNSTPTTETFYYNTPQAVKTSPYADDTDQFLFGYWKFAYWYYYDRDEGKGYRFKSGEEVTFTKDVQMTAYYYAATYKIKYNANGGVGEMQTKTYEGGQTITLDANTYTMEGYVFKGWGFYQYGHMTGVRYEDGATYDGMYETYLTSGGIPVLRLYAIWEEVV